MPAHVGEDFLCERAKVLCALAANQIQNGGFSATAAENDVAFEGQNVRGPTGLVPRNRFLF